MNQKPVFKSKEGKEAILAVYDTVLKNWPVPYKEINLETRYGNTYMIECGDESLPPLILLHGSSSNSSMWIGDVATYSRKFRVFAVDMPGEPGKSQDTRYDLTTAAYAEWLEDVHTGLGIKKASIAGISLGGWTALKFAVTFPQRVEKLVLLCPSGVGPQNAAFLFYVIPMMLLGKWGKSKVAKKIYGSDDIPEEALKYSNIIGNNFSPYVGLIPIFSDEELKRLTMPVLLIAGEKDFLLQSQKTVERLSGLLPKADVRLLPGIGHVLINQQDQILDFLEK